MTGTWDEYVQSIEDPLYKKAKGYYHRGQLRIEMAPVGHDHASDNSILADDLGRKRILYEDLEIPEYWVTERQQAEVTAFSINNNGSRRIRESKVLPGFSMALLAEALQRNLAGNQSQVVTWLLAQFQTSS